MMRAMDLADVAAELYALLPGEFTAARNERAKRLRAEGQAFMSKQVARLAKPSVAAWAANALIRHRPDEFARVLDLGASFRDAQEGLDPGRMRELGRERAALLSEVMQAARVMAADRGVKVSDPAAAELEQTLRAAMADPQAAAAVRSGLLVRSLVSNGLEPVDLAGALAVPGALPEAGAERPSEALLDLRSAQKSAAGVRDSGTGSGSARADSSTAGADPTIGDARLSAAEEDARRRATEAAAAEEAATQARLRERQQAEADLAEARIGLADAESELADAQDQAREAAALRSSLAQALAELRARIDDLEEDLAAAEREVGLTERARRLASRLAEQERRAVERASARLGHLP